MRYSFFSTVVVVACLVSTSRPVKLPNPLTKGTIPLRTFKENMPKKEQKKMQLDSLNMGMDMFAQTSTSAECETDAEAESEAEAASQKKEAAEDEI